MTERRRSSRQPAPAPKRGVQRAKQRHPARSNRPGKRPQSPRARRRRALLTTVMLGLLVIAFLFAFVYPTRTFLNQRDDLSASEQRLHTLQDQTAKLKRETAKLDTDAEIERRAREQYGLVRPGEMPYVLVPSTPTTTAPPTTTPPQGSKAGQP